MWSLISVCLETLLNRSTVYAKHTVGSQIIWTHPMVLLGNEAQVDARFGLFGDSANLVAIQAHGLCQHTIGSEIILDASDGSPR
jgi:hypothetical protein